MSAREPDPPRKSILMPFYCLETQGQGPINLSSCGLCGAAIIMDEGNGARHVEWHRDRGDIE